MDTVADETVPHLVAHLRYHYEFAPTAPVEETAFATKRCAHFAGTMQLKLQAIDSKSLLAGHREHAL